MIKEFISNYMVCKDSFSKNIEHYTIRSLEKANAIYFYGIVPLEEYSTIDTMSWIKKIEHEEYDMISIQWANGRKMYYQSKVLSDKVIKLDLTDNDVKKIFDDKFKIGAAWLDVETNNPLFSTDPGYELRNFILTKDNDIIMLASLHEDFNIAISKDIVDEVDKECKRKQIKNLLRIVFPFLS